MNWRDVAKREVKQMFTQDPKRVMYLFGACAVYILLFGLLYSSHVITAIPIVVQDEDQTYVSRSLSQAFEDSERYQVIAYVSTSEESQEFLRDKKAQAVITIPATFSRDIKTGHSASVLVEANGANVAIANTALTTAQEIVQTFSSRMGVNLITATGQMPEQALHKVAPVGFQLRILHNSTLSYLDFFVLGLAMAALQQGILLAVGASMISEYKNMEELQHVRPLQVIIGKLVPYWICGTLSFVMALGISSTAFHIPFKGDWGSLLAIGIAFSFAITAFGSVIAALCKNEVSYTQLTLIYAVPAFVFSGYTWPQHSMNALSLLFSHTFPLSYFADTIRALMVSGHAPALLKNILMLLFMGAILLTISIFLYSRKRKHLPTPQQSDQASHLSQ
jgi:ABC-2 type transport system permease protein